MNPKTVFKMLYTGLSVAALLFFLRYITAGAYPNALISLLIFAFCAWRFYLTDKGRV